MHQNTNDHDIWAKKIACVSLLHLHALTQQGLNLPLEPIEKYLIGLLGLLLLNPMTALQGLDFQIKYGFGHIHLWHHIVFSVDH